MLRISQIKLRPIAREKDSDLKARLVKKVSSVLRVSEADITDLWIAKKSIDARKKNDIHLVLTADVKVNGENRILKKNRDKNVNAVVPVVYNPVVSEGLSASDRSRQRIVIVGDGPAGLFAAYILSTNGYRPLVIERGRSVDRRQVDVDRYWESGELDSSSNVQFGEGGAGTFSDGKLNTQVKDSSGRIAYVLKVLSENGAPENITYEQKPHVGTDVLKKVVTSIREKCEQQGATFRFETCLTGICCEGGRVSSIEVNHCEKIDVDAVILAIGHSARDTFSMLKDSGIDMEPKSFAVGFRVQHPQKLVNEFQYGEEMADYFGAAPYKLTAKSSDGRGVYSFCMCPGGYVVDASSEKGRLCVNGMSYSGRDSSNANSAMIVAVNPEDYIAELNKADVKYDADDPLIGMYFQRLLEERTYMAGNGKIPLQRFADYEREVTGVDTSFDDLSFESVHRGRSIYSSLKGILPESVEKAFVEGMHECGRKIKGFDMPSAILAGTESRTSSPVRINRDECGQSSVAALFPCGEGAGYAGGITSAAVDGIRMAEAVMDYFSNKD